MSTSKVWLTTIDDVHPHPNADKLELATVHGWQMVVKKEAFRSGDPVLYFEQGLVLPSTVAEILGVTNYLSTKTDIHGEKVGVIHRVKLRGEPSFGLVVPATTPTDILSLCAGVTKFQPPLRTIASDTLPNHPAFPPYTDIENLRSYPTVLMEGEIVVVSEKIHGTNCRVGFVRQEDGTVEWFAGSRQWQRVRPDVLEQDTYWFPLTLPEINEHGLLGELEKSGCQSAVLYGEVYGRGIRAYVYNQPGKAFRAFDLMIDGRYVDHDYFRAKCDIFKAARVPVDYVGPYSLEKVRALSESPSALGNPQGREGVVVKPVTERNDPVIGRVVLKYISDTYLFGDTAANDTTDA